MLGDKAFEGDSHALLMAVCKNEELSMEMRLDAAKAAIRFEKPALSSVDQKSYLPIGSLSAEEWLAEHGHLNGEKPKPSNRD